jgi:hypothetical protein
MAVGEFNLPYGEIMQQLTMEVHIESAGFRRQLAIRTWIAKWLIRIAARVLGTRVYIEVD